MGYWLQGLCILCNHHLFSTSGYSKKRMQVALFFILAVVQGMMSSTQLYPPKRYRSCFAPGRVAGIRLCCPRFLQHACNGGSRVTVVSSTNTSAKSSPRSFSQHSSNTSGAFSLASFSLHVSGSNRTSAVDLGILCASTTPETGFCSG